MSTHPVLSDNTHIKKWTLILVLVILVFLLSTAGVIYVVMRFGIGSMETLHLARVLGYIASAVVFVQWMPQIVLTYRQKASGALSIPMLVLYVMSSMIAIFYLMILIKQDISVYISYFYAGAQQTILLIMCFFFDYIIQKPVDNFSTAISDDEEPSPRSI